MFPAGKKNAAESCGIVVRLTDVQEYLRMNSPIFGATISCQRRPEKMP
jgi:hypothetical protein